jgi:hypothetical protein
MAEQEYSKETTTLGGFHDFARFSPEMTEALDEVILEAFDDDR